MNKIGVKVIRPPAENIKSGHIFRPSRLFFLKQAVKYEVALLIIWATVNFGFILAIRAATFFFPTLGPADQIIGEWWWPVLYWTFFIGYIWYIPMLVWTWFAVENLKYSVKAEAGGSMPEIYVKRGVFTVSENHIPFRTITNIGSRAGMFDRLFHLGTVHIETAGHTPDDGPDEKLEGIIFYEEVRDFILRELRKIQGSYPPAIP